jgi:glutamyl-tRNA synthetase
MTTEPNTTTEPGRPVVTRFAPSPTGHLHIGGVRTALFCYAFARRHGGSFLLRVEDTDVARSTEDAAAGILSDLAWCNISWDEGPAFQFAATTIGGDPRGVGPFRQSERGETYRHFFDMLVQAGLAYPAFDTPEELTAMRAEAERAKRTFRYTRDPGYDHAAALERARAEEHVLRLKTGDEPIVVRDEVLGDGPDKTITFTTEHFDDFIIRKRDGMPTYHFAVVIDDALMGVTHVLRGQEHLNNTPKHVALMNALASADAEHAERWSPPVYAHMPLIFNVKGAKMSKRERDVAAKAACKEQGIETSPAPDALSDAAYAKWLGDKKAQLDPKTIDTLASALGLGLPEVSVYDFMRAGYLPEALNNFLALLGWSPSKDARGALKAAHGGADSERFDMGFLVEHFDLAGIGRSNARFDREKLLAFNAETIQHGLTDERFLGLWKQWLQTFEPDLLAKLDAALGSDERWLLAATAARPRAKTLRDAAEPIAFLLLDADAIVHDDKAVKKGLLKGEPSGLEVLPELREHLAKAAWQEGPAALEASVKAFCDAKDLNMGKAAQPIRIALTGTAVSPPLGETLALVGRDETLARIDHLLSAQRERAD